MHEGQYQSSGELDKAVYSAEEKDVHFRWDQDSQISQKIALWLLWTENLHIEQGFLIGIQLRYTLADETMKISCDLSL